MTKKYWIGVMIFSLLIAAGAGYFVWTTLQQKTPVEVPLQTIEPTPEPSQADSIVEETPVPSPDSSSSPVKTDEPIPTETKSKEKKASIANDDKSSEKRNILFTYRKASAKEVFLIGSFNKWTREPMKKNEKGIWQVSEKLAPGSYEYKFVVDNRKIRDPNNRLYTPAGNSILKVKPLADK